ncbi:hypothetical protein ACNQFZ_04420 [Schinkia sp. CFF1]
MQNTREDFEAVIEKLRNGELEQFVVRKEEFLLFREVLMKQKDKENIQGEAKKGGEVAYSYHKE